MKYKVSYETYIVVEAKDEDEALLKAGEQPMDEWRDGETEVVEDE